MKKAAIFTKIKNGHEVFQLWYRYYSKFFADEDIYVLDFGSIDGSTDGLKCNVVARTESWNLGGRDLKKSREITNAFKTKLLKEYKYVVYSDYDEIIYTPRGLDVYLDLVARMNIASISCTGYEIVQTPKEPKIDFGKPILSQRSSWFRWNLYDKPLITQVDFQWGEGFHTLEDQPHPPTDPDLWLIHLHKIDRQLAQDLNITNVVKVLVGRNLCTPANNLSPNQMKDRLEAYKSAAIIRNGVQLSPSGDCSPFMLVCPDKSILYHPLVKCCLCGLEVGRCGHQNFFLGLQFDVWWDETTPHLVDIPESFKQTNAF